MVKKNQSAEIGLPVPEASKKAGNLFVCGEGTMAQLGLGEDITERKRPALVASVEDVVDICAGGMHSLCLTKSGEIFSFGCNDEGALGRDTSEDGSEFTPEKVYLPGKVVKISAGDSHSACLLSDGRLFAWGSFRDSHGNMGLTLDGNKRIPFKLLPEQKCVDIASGADHLVILTSNGKIYSVGCGEQGQLGRVSLRSASGETRRGKKALLEPLPVILRLNSKIRSAEKIWATNYCTFVKVTKEDSIFAFGLNNYRQCGLDKNENLSFFPSKSSFENVEKIAGGQHHTLVLTKDNKCFAIGRKDYGRLGLGNVKEDVEKLTIVKSLADKTVTDVSCGETQSFALTADGDVYSWGMGSNHQLGTGSEDDVLEPVQIVSKQTEGKQFLKVSSGGQHTIFIVAKETTAARQVNKVQPNKRKINGEDNQQPPSGLENKKSKKATTPSVEAGGPEKHVEEAATSSTQDETTTNQPKVINKRGGGSKRKK